jgi:hypothetical protein
VSDNPSAIIRAAEQTEIDAWWDAWQAAPAKTREALGLASAKHGGVAVLQAPVAGHWLFNRVLGLGVFEEASRDLVDSICDGLVAAGSSHGVSLVETARPTDLPQWLLGRGFEQTTTLARMLRGVEDLPAPRVEVDIRLVEEEDAEAFGHAVASGFGLPPVFAPWMSALCGREGWRTYLAYVDDAPVATGALHIQSTTGWLGFGSTTPEARGRGIHHAMFCRRMSDAAERGCTLLQTETNFGEGDEPTPSLDNMKRVGFEVAYPRPNYVFTPAK